MLVGVDHDRIRLVLRDKDSHDLLCEGFVPLGRHGALVRLHRQSILVGAAYGESGAQVLGGLDHATRHREVPAAGGDPRPREPVGERDGLTFDTPAHPGGIELCLAHRLGAAGEDQVGRARRDLHARLQARSAPAVHLQAGDLDAESRIERGDAADRGGLAAGRRLAEDDVVDVGAGDAGTGDELADHGAGERLGRDVLEDAAEATHRGA